MNTLFRSSAMLFSGMVLAVATYAFTQDAPPEPGLSIAPPPAAGYTNPVAPDFPSVMITTLTAQNLGAIDSELTMTGHNGDYVVFDYEHTVETDNSGGFPLGGQHFGMYEVVIPFDKGGVKLYDAWLQGYNISMVLSFYRAPVATPASYLTTTLTNARIVRIESVDGIATGTGFNPTRHLLKVSFTYDLITLDATGTVWQGDATSTGRSPVHPRPDSAKPVDGGAPADSATGVVEKD